MNNHFDFYALFGAIKPESLSKNQKLIIHRKLRLSMYMILSYPRTQYSCICITMVHTHCLVTTNGKNSARGWARTWNLLIRSPALCQLSYTGIYTCYAPIMLYILAVILLEYWGSFVFWGSLRLNLVHRLPTYFNNELHTFENCLKKQLYSSRSTLYPNTKFSMYVPDYTYSCVHSCVHMERRAARGPPW